MENIETPYHMIDSSAKQSYEQKHTSFVFWSAMKVGNKPSQLFPIWQLTFVH